MSLCSPGNKGRPPPKKNTLVNLSVAKQLAQPKSQKAQKDKKKKILKRKKQTLSCIIFQITQNMEDNFHTWLA